MLPGHSGSAPEPVAGAPDPDDERDVGPAEPEASEVQRTRGRLTTISILVGSLVLAMVTGAGLYFVLKPQVPGGNSAEAGFARDMQVHHAQAVEMALVVREKSADPVLRSVAYDIATTQQQQMGQMYAWLEMWSVAKARPGQAMTWMRGMDHSAMSGAKGAGDDGAMPMTLLPDGRMPGMASRADMQRLRDLSGTPAEVLFLQLMITHHKAGVMMADAILQQAEVTAVRRLATAIRISQRAEIRALEDLLAERGAGPRPEAG
jgi:uncharacterized protein (DUF305 family)